MKRENMIKFRIQQLGTLCKLGCAFFISIFFRKKSLWLISERGTDAKDNGYWLFKYIKDNHPEIDVRYILSKDSPDRNKLTQYESDIVEFRSFHHCLLLWQASHLISTHIQGYFPFVGLGLYVKRHFGPYRNKKHIFLQHGITINRSPFLEYSNTTIDLITVGVRPEYNYFISNYKYPTDVVQLTGFCRFDQLTSFQTKRQILVMPTWRDWIYVDSEFPNSDFAKQNISFLTDPRLPALLNSNNINLIFYLHPAFQKHIDVFKRCNLDHRIIIASEKDYDIQPLLKESLLLITDYSSVFFDFVYMKKPVIFFQFDIEKFRQAHYANGWFDYNLSFGPVVSSKDNLINAIEQCVNQNFTMEDKYQSRVDEYFPLRDTLNTHRVFDCIKRL